MQSRCQWNRLALAAGLLIGLLPSACTHHDSARNDDASAVTAAPTLRAVFGETSSLDAGTLVTPLAQGVPSVAVTIVNPGDRALHIDTLETSCGCLSAELVPIEIPANAESVLQLRLAEHVGGKSERRTYQISMRTTDDEAWQLNLTGAFLAPQSWEPNQLLFYNLQQDEQRTAQAVFRLTGRSDTPPEFHASVLPEDAPISASIEVLDSECLTDTAYRHQYLVNVLVAGRGDAGDHAASVVLESPAARYELPVNWEIRQPVTAHPSRIGFLGGTTRERAVILTSNDGTAFRILGVSSNASAFQIIHDQDAKATHRILLHEPETTDESSARDWTVTFTLDHPEQTEVDLDISLTP